MDERVSAPSDVRFSGVLTQLRGYLGSAGLPDDGRLPPERELADVLGVTRAELRKGLAEAGLPNLFIPTADSFFEVEKIPVLGTGKLDLKAMRTVAEERVKEEKVEA